MRRTVVALALGALAVGGWPTIQAVAQDTKTARGTVTVMAAGSVTVKVANVDMTFGVDGKTTVEAAGAGTKARAAEKAGAGLKLAEVVKVGQAVEVSYRGTGGTLHAVRIRAVSSPGPDLAVPVERSSNGTVQSVTATSMTITGSGGGGATFTQTFMITPDTTVTGRGAGTAAAAKGGRTVITDLVGKGDTVSVSYKEMGTGLHASGVRVTAKAAVK